MIAVDEREKTGEYQIQEPDYGELIIEMVHKIDKTDTKFLMQVYTIMHRHIEKRGR